MFNKSYALFGTGIIILASLTSQASADNDHCLSAKGKITNNAQAGGFTQGVATLKLGHKKLRCSIVGVSQQLIPGEPNFLHTVVCNNKALPNDAQSQLTLKTWFLSEPVVTGSCDKENLWGPVSFSFEEMSIPDPSSARGDFIGVTDTEEDGNIIIKGNYNCNGGITMKFKGQLCFAD